MSLTKFNLNYLLNNIKIVMSSGNASDMNIHNRSIGAFGGQFSMRRRKSEQQAKYKKVHRHG